MASSTPSSTRRRPSGNRRGQASSKQTSTGRRKPSKPSPSPGRPRPVAYDRSGYRQDSIRARASSDRFADRRQEIRRREGARRLRVVLALTVVSLMAVSAIGVLNSDLADVDTVAVVGNDRTPSADVVAATGIQAGQPLLDLDLSTAEAGVEALPWIRRSTVERRFNGEIVVTVSEREPVLALPVTVAEAAGSAVARGPGRYVLIDRLGQQLDVVPERPDGYLPINGIEASGRPGESAPQETGPVLSLVQSLPAQLLADVEALTVIDGHIHLELTTGGRANLGDGSLLGEKIQALETVLARVDLQCVELIDLRVPSAPAVLRAESAEGTCI